MSKVLEARDRGSRFFAWPRLADGAVVKVGEPTEVLFGQQVFSILLPIGGQYDGYVLVDESDVVLANVFVQEKLYADQPCAMNVDSLKWPEEERKTG